MSRATIPSRGSAGASACALNIGRAERRLRAAGGWAALLAAAGSAVALVAGDAPSAWRLALFIPLLAGAIGLLQAHEGT